LTERGLRDVEALSGATEMQFFSDGDEVSQMTQFHTMPPLEPSLGPDRNRTLA